MSLQIDELLDDIEKISLSEFIHNRLYFVSYKEKIPTDSETLHYFTSDSDIKGKELENINLGNILKQIKKFQWITNQTLSNKILVFFSTGCERRRYRDSIFIGIYAVMLLKLSFDEVKQKLTEHTSIEFEKPHLSESLSGIQKAVQLGLINIEDFDEVDFYSLHKIKLHWIVPNKILSFSGPLNSSSEHYVQPRCYVKILKKSNVSTIIRASHFRFDANPFINVGFSHYDLGMEDNIPTDDILEAFLEICESSKETIVIHCRDSTKRLGNLISAYLVKHYGLSAGEALAWVCLCSSGSYYESSWLKKKVNFLKESGDAYRSQKYGNTTGFPHHDLGVNSCCYSEEKILKDRELAY